MSVNAMQKNDGPMHMFRYVTIIFHQGFLYMYYTNGTAKQ